jgi:hypothetical protein
MDKILIQDKYPGTATLIERKGIRPINYLLLPMPGFQFPRIQSFFDQVEPDSE